MCYRRASMKVVKKRIDSSTTECISRMVTPRIIVADNVLFVLFLTNDLRHISPEFNYFLQKKPLEGTPSGCYILSSLTNFPTSSLAFQLRQPFDLFIDFLHERSDGILRKIELDVRSLEQLRQGSRSAQFQRRFVSIKG